MNNPNAYKDNNAPQGRSLLDVMIVPLLLVGITIVALVFLAK